MDMMNYHGVNGSVRRDNPNMEINGKRHFGRTGAGNNETVVILGYNPRDNAVLILRLDYLNAEEDKNIREIVLGENAQGRDYLMDDITGSVMAQHSHPRGKPWLEYIVTQLGMKAAATSVLSVDISKIAFEDESQRAYFLGQGPSIEPMNHQTRMRRLGYEADGKPIMAGSQTQQTGAIVDSYTAPAGTTGAPVPPATYAGTPMTTYETSDASVPIQTPAPAPMEAMMKQMADMMAMQTKAMADQQAAVTQQMASMQEAIGAITENQAALVENTKPARKKPGPKPGSGRPLSGAAKAKHEAKMARQASGTENQDADT